MLRLVGQAKLLLHQLAFCYRSSRDGCYNNLGVAGEQLSSLQAHKVVHGEFFLYVSGDVGNSCLHSIRLSYCTLVHGGFLVVWL